MMIAPRLVAGGWVGDDGRTDGSTVLTRALGVRDAMLGAMTLHVIDRPGVGARTVATVAAADAVDALATFAVRRSLPLTGRFGVLAIASAATGAGIALSRGLPAASAAAPQSAAPAPSQRAASVADAADAVRAAAST